MLRRLLFQKYKLELTTGIHAHSHENVVWKSEFTFFQSLVIIPTRLICQMQVNSSGAEPLSTTFKFIKRKKLSLVIYAFNQPELTTGIVKREIRHFHVVVLQ